jgi:MFS family permease
VRQDDAQFHSLYFLCLSLFQIRNYFNSLHILFFDLSMVIFNPILAYIGLFIGQHAVNSAGGVDEDQIDELTLLIAIGGVFFLSTVLTLLAYNIYMPDLHDHGPQPVISAPMSQGQINGQDSILVSQGGASDASSEPVPDPLSWAQFQILLTSVKEGAVLTWSNTRIRYRVLFFAVETSVEDAMIALIAAMVGSEVFADSEDKLHYAYGNLWGAFLVAVGKVGGVLASVLMHKYFTVDEAAEKANPGQAYRPLFWFAFLGGLCSLLLPVGLHLREHDTVPEIVTTIIIFAAMFFFFLFSTLSKIGFSTLMQSMAGESEATGRIFGFVAAYVTATDALILMGMAALFSAMSLQGALWVATGFIALHGFVELVFGPSLVLKKKEEGLDERMNLSEPLM